MRNNVLLNETMMDMEANISDFQEATDNWLTTNHVLLTSLNVIAMFTTYGTMFFMGCDITLQQIKEAWNYRKYIPIGLVGQYLLMPVCGFLVIKLFGITSTDAVGITITTCSPGGGYSNLLTYLLDGDVWLSVMVTTISTVLAFGAMPINLWLYSPSSSLSVPYLQMFIALLLLNVLLILGLLFKWKAPIIAVQVTRVGVTLLAVSNVVWTILWIYLNPMFFLNTSWRLYLSVFVVIGLGIASMSLVTRLLNFSTSIIKTLAIETSYQSVGTAFTVTLISFEKQTAMKVQGYIFLYSIFTTFFGTVCGGTYQLIKSRRNSKKPATQLEGDALKA